MHRLGILCPPHRARGDVYQTGVVSLNRIDLGDDSPDCGPVFGGPLLAAGDDESLLALPRSSGQARLFHRGDEAVGAKVDEGAQTVILAEAAPRVFAGRRSIADPADCIQANETRLSAFRP